MFGPLNRVLKAIIKITKNFEKLHSKVLKIFAKEASLFLNNEVYRSKVRERLLDKILDELDEEIILVGHSLGSVVCLETLHHLESKVSIARFVCLGSPLGTPIFHKFFKNKEKPEVLKGDWYNIYDVDDFVSSFLLTNPPYQVIPKIINVEAKTKYFQAHHRLFR